MDSNTLEDHEKDNDNPRVTNEEKQPQINHSHQIDNDKCMIIHNNFLPNVLIQNILK